MAKIPVWAISGGGLSKSDFKLRVAYSISIPGDEDQRAEPDQYTSHSTYMQSPIGISKVANRSGIIPILGNEILAPQNYYLSGVYLQDGFPPFTYGYGNSEIITERLDTNATFPYYSTLSYKDENGYHCYAKIRSITLKNIDINGQIEINVESKFWTEAGYMRRGQLPVFLEFKLQ